jgi:hypothetical protein
MGATQVLGAAIVVVRRSPWLFGSLALCGAAPLCTLVLALHHLGILRGGARGSPSDAVIFLAFLTTVAVFARVFFHAAALRALSGVLGGQPVDLARALRDAARGWLPALVAGGAVSVLGVLSGFLFYVPVAVFGGVFLLALPRVVLDGEGPWPALTRPHAGRAGRKALAVNFLFFVLAAALFANIYLLVHLVLALGRSFFDLDVAYLVTVLSLDNGVYVLALACLTLALLEPVRIVCAGLVHLEAKVRREGLDLAPRIDALGRPRRGARRAAIWLVGILAAPAVARAVPAADAREAVAALAADLAEKEVTLSRIRALARRQRDAAPHRGALFRLIEERLAQASREHPDLRRVIGGRLAEDLRRAVASPDPAGLLETVLAAPEFGDLDPGAWSRPPEPAPERARREDLDLSRLRLERGEGASGFTVLAVVLVALAVGAALAVAFLGLTSRRRARPPPAPAPPVAPPPALGLDALARDPSEWRAEADAWAARGEYREAMRRLYLSVLVTLHRARAIEYDRSRTNGDYLRRFQGGPPERALFRDLTRAFDFGWYGERPVDAPAYEEFSRRADALVARAAVPSGGAA